MNEGNLHDAKVVTLIRVQNGWVMFKETDSHQRNLYFVFESTQSLQKNLVKLLGNSGWAVVPVMPERDEKGHFKKAQP